MTVYSARREADFVMPSLIWKKATFRLMLRAQPVDATPSSQSIRQHFPMENDFARLYSIRPQTGWCCV